MFGRNPKRRRYVPQRNTLAWEREPVRAPVPAIETRQPASKLNLESGVTVPVAQALWLALVTGLLFAAGAYLIGWPGQSILDWTLAGFAITLTATSYLLFMLAYDGLYAWELLTNTDLDGDGVVGKPAEVRVWSERKNASGYSSVLSQELPLTEEQLADFAAGLLSGRYTLSHSGVPGYVPRDRIAALEAAFVELGWGSRRKGQKNQPFGLTELGREELGQLAG